MKRILLCLVMLLGLVVVAPAGNVYAAEDETNCDKMLLGMKPWYAGLTDSNCNIKTPEKDGLSNFVWTIVTNVLYDMFVVIGYLAIGFIMFGGYTYLLARGDPGRIEKAKKTLVAAVSGLVISLLASVIVSFIADNILVG